MKYGRRYLILTSLLCNLIFISGCSQSNILKDQNLGSNQIIRKETTIDSNFTGSEKDISQVINKYQYENDTIHQSIEITYISKTEIKFSLSTINKKREKK